MKREERAKMVAAMEYICRHINDELVFESWLSVGVADGDIAYGDFSGNVDDYYLENDNFAELMGRFLKRMALAKKYGGLYCDNVVSSGE